MMLDVGDGAGPHKPAAEAAGHMKCDDQAVTKFLKEFPHTGRVFLLGSDC